MRNESDIRYEEAEGEFIIFIPPEFESPSTEHVFELAQAALADPTEPTIIVDLRDNENIYSAGLRVIVSIQNDCESQYRQFKIRNLSVMAERLMELVGIKERLAIEQLGTDPSE